MMKTDYDSISAWEFALYDESDLQDIRDEIQACQFERDAIADRYCYDGVRRRSDWKSKDRILFMMLDTRIRDLQGDLAQAIKVIRERDKM